MSYFEYHFHGCAGHKTTELNWAAYEAMSRFLLKRGETDAFLATFSAAPLDCLLEALDFCRSLMESKPVSGAQLKGVYLEGPFLHNPGGMTASLLARPTLKAAKEIMAHGEGILKTIAIAPELPGAMKVIEYFASEGVSVSAGHFCCKPEVLREAVRCGVERITHFCCNGEGNLECRFGRYCTEGPFLEILADDHLTVEVISDGVHVDPRLLKTIWRVKGRGRFLPVTDGCAATGMKGKRLVFPDPAGTPAEFDVRNGALYIADTDQLTGSLATMKIVRENLVKFCGMTAEEADYACSELPRKLTGTMPNV